MKARTKQPTTASRGGPFPRRGKENGQKGTLSATRGREQGSAFNQLEAFPYQELLRQSIARRAIEGAIWGMPIVSVHAMREAFFRDAGAKYGDIIYWSKPSDWKNQLTTPNASSLYVYFNFNTKNGPVVLDFPAAVGAGLFGTLLNAWQVPLVDVGPKGGDGGKGGKYLILPPDYKGKVPPGHIPVRSATYNGYALFRAIPASSAETDRAKAVALVRKQQIYPLARASNPPKQRFIDMAGKAFDGIVRYDASFYTALAHMINEEPVQPCDLVAMGQLRSLGIHKGNAFRPDILTKKELGKAIREAHAWFMSTNVEWTEPWWRGSQWGLSKGLPFATKTRFSFIAEDYLGIDARAPIYFLAFATPARLGEASFYLVAWKDGKGEPLQGKNSYRLHIPPNVPAGQFWAVTVYDLETAGFLRHSPRVGLDSYDQKMRRNGDGSVDVCFGPEPIPGQEMNWVYTAPGKRWFAMFRFYAPKEMLFQKKWKLPEIQTAR